MYPFSDRIRNVLLSLFPRFSNPGLFPRAARLVKVGGFVLWTAFLEGAFRPFNAQKLLRKGELTEIFGGFPDHKFEIIVDESATLEDGRPIQHFLARRIA